MPKKNRHSLQRTMILYFLLIGFATCFAGIEFILDGQWQGMREGLSRGLDACSVSLAHKDALLAPIAELRAKAVLMVGIVVFVMLILLTMFVKRITVPLQEMIRTARGMSQGDLSRAIRISADNELAELGGVINELSTNLQEVLMLSSKLCADSADFLSQTEALRQGRELSPEERAALVDRMETFRQEVLSVGEMLEFFSFYTVDGKESQ